MSSNHLLSSWAALIPLAAAAACADPMPATTDAAADVRSFDLTISWQSCPLLSGGTGDGAECAEIEVPADWDDPDGDTISVFLKRVDPPGADKQVWLLNGGPGASGADLEPMVSIYQAADPGIAVYLLDHRGTGRSHRLGCPQESDDSAAGFAITDGEWPDCIAALTETEGSLLDAFTVSQAARDVGELIEATREPYDSVHVWGGSYGTRWTQRYLHFYAEQATTVTLQGIASPGISFSAYDENYDAVAREYLAACAGDVLCSSKLGADPAATFSDLYAALEAGHCSPATRLGFTPRALRRLFAVLLLTTWHERVLVPALVHRIERCSAADVGALVHLATVLAPEPLSVQDRLFSVVLATHIGISELWDEDAPTEAEAQDVVDAAVASLELTLRMTRRAPTWPVYAPDELENELPVREGPMRMLQGTLDPATTLAGANEVAAAFDRPGQIYIVFPDGAHSNDVPIAGSGESCSWRELTRFVIDPSAPPDGCAGRLEALEFGGADLAPLVFGTDDLWDGGPGAAGSLAAASDPRIEAIRRAWSNPR